MVDLKKYIFSVESNKKEGSKEIKELEFDDRVEIMREVLAKEEIKSSYFVMNIFNLIKDYNSFDESFFTSETSIVNSLAEYIDMKRELKNEIQTFITNFTYYFLSIIKYASKLEYTNLDNVKPLPTVFQRIILVTDFLTIASIIAKSENIETDKLCFVENAYSYIVTLSSKCNVSDIFFSSLVSSLGIESE